MQGMVEATVLGVCCPCSTRPRLTVWLLPPSPCPSLQGKTAQEVFSSLQSENPEETQAALQRLSKASADITFAQEFCNRGGGDLLVKMVEEGTE